MQWPLQTPGGVELLVVGFIFLVPLAAIGLLLIVLHRVTRHPPARETAVGDEVNTGTAPRHDTDVQSDQADATVERRDQTERRDGLGLPLSRAALRTIDWFVALCLFLLGLLSLLAGAGAGLLADREALADFVAREAVQTEGISEATFVDLAFVTLRWGGIALALVGLFLVFAGLWFAVARRRLDSQSATESGSVAPTLSNALLGAVVSLVAGAIPLSPALGGGAAGYLQCRDRWAGLRVGLLSGLALSLPAVVVFGAIATGLFVEGYAAVGLVVASGLVATLSYCLLLSGVGGFVGGFLFESEEMV